MYDWDVRRAFMSELKTQIKVIMGFYGRLER